MFIYITNSWRITKLFSYDTVFARLKDLASVNVIKQICVVVTLAYATWFQSKPHTTFSQKKYQENVNSWFFLLTFCKKVWTHLKNVCCFAFIVFSMSCYCKCPVALPHGTVGWSAVCECRISWSYSITFCYVEPMSNWISLFEHDMAFQLQTDMLCYRYSCKNRIFSLNYSACIFKHVVRWTLI